MPVDVVICSKDREALCWAQIAQIRKKIPHGRIIVVDGSEQPYDLDGVVHLSMPNIKLGPARNMGLEHVETPETLVLDDDLIYGPTFYATLSKHLNSSKEVAAVSGMVQWGYPDHKTMMRLHSNPRSIGHSGGCALFKTDILKKLGGYHPEMHRGEDSELFYRLRKHGYKWLRVPEPVGHPCTVRQYLTRNMHNPEGIIETWKSGSAPIAEILARRTLRPLIMPFYYAWKARDVKVYPLYFASSFIYAFYSWHYFLNGWRRWLE